MRATGPAPTRNVYAEVAVYALNASTGLAWPTDFTMLPQSRQFITLHLEPRQADRHRTSALGSAVARALRSLVHLRSGAERPGSAAGQGANVGTNVANSNSIAWRNLKIVNPRAVKPPKFIVRNIQAGVEQLELQFDVTPALFQTGKFLLRFDDTLQRGITDGKQARRSYYDGKGRFQRHLGEVAHYRYPSGGAGEHGYCPAGRAGGESGWGRFQITR